MNTYEFYLISDALKVAEQKYLESAAWWHERNTDDNPLAGTMEKWASRKAGEYAALRRRKFIQEEDK